ncbi:MAG: tetratricopeptide repeat protein [Planctomycetota bacterium]
MTLRPLALPLLALALIGAGCQTIERTPGRADKVVEDGPRPDRVEEALLEKIEEEPERPEHWYRLAAHYEQGLRYSEAYAAYARFQQELGKLEDKAKLPMERRSTLGLWHLGMLADRLGDAKLALKLFVELIDRRPQKIEAARANSHFQDAYLFLAQYYYRTEKDDKAYQYVMIHRELGGTRGDGILIGLERRKAARGGANAKSVGAGAQRGEQDGARPAAADKSGQR